MLINCVGLVAFIWLFIDVSITYFSYETVTQFELLNGELEKPAVSICLNSIKDNQSIEYLLNAGTYESYSPPSIYDNQTTTCKHLFDDYANCEPFLHKS